MRFLGYEISEVSIRPDPDVLQPTGTLLPLTNVKSKWRVVGLFSFCSKCISYFSENTYPSFNNTEFPLSAKVSSVFNRGRKKSSDSWSLQLIILSLPYGNGRLRRCHCGSIHLKTSFKSGTGPQTVGKEDFLIVKAIRNWDTIWLEHDLHSYRIKNPFYSNSTYHIKTRIKTKKIKRCRMELTSFSFHI